MPNHDRSFISLGDSITWQDGKPYNNPDYPYNRGLIARGFQTILAETLDFSTHINAGVSGRPMADGSINGPGTVTTCLAQDFSPHGLAIVAAGTNDFRLDIPLGSIETTHQTPYDRTTFYGAYQVLIEHITAHRSITGLVLFTPTHRNNSGYNSWSTVNQAGHTLADYVEAIYKIAERHNLQIVDQWQFSGIDKETLSTYLMDGLHPNDEGYAVMGELATKVIGGIL